MSRPQIDYDELASHVRETTDYDVLAQKARGPKVSAATQAILNAQAKKFPTEKESGVPVEGATIGKVAKGMAGELADYTMEEGPAMGGAVVGGIVGSTAGPAGTIAGAAAGAAAARTAQLAYRAKYGDVSKVPATPGAVLKDVGGHAASGAVQEALPVVISSGKAAAGRLLDVISEGSPFASAGANATEAAGGRSIGPIFKNRLTPEQQKAVDLARTSAPKLYDAMSVDQKTGDSLAAGAKAVVRHLPGGSGIVDANETAAKEAYSQLGTDIGERIGQTPGKLALGQQIKSTVASEGGRIDSAVGAARDVAIADARTAAGPPPPSPVLDIVLNVSSLGESKPAGILARDIAAAKNAAAEAGKETVENPAWNSFRGIVNAPENAVEVQVGTKDVTTRAGIAGTETTKTVPIIEKVNSPVDLRGMKEAIRPILERLRSMSQTARAGNAPGYNALADFLDRPDYISADDAQKEISSLGKIAFRKDFPAMTEAGPALVKKIRELMNAALDQTAGKVGAKDALAQARAATVERFGTFGTKTAQAAAGKAERPILAMLRDGNVIEIQSLIKQTGGEELPAIRRALGDQLTKKATDATGRIDPEKWATLWKGLGDELKTTVFTPEQIAAFDKTAAAAVTPHPRNIVDSVLAKSLNPDGTVDAVKAARNWNSLSAEVKAHLTADQIAAMDKAVSPELLYGPNHPVTRAYQTVKALTELSPSEAVNALVQKDEVQLPELRQVLRLNPALAESLGKTTFQGIMEGSTGVNGFLPAQAFRKWNSLGRQTQLALMGNDAKLVEDIGSFFRLGSLLKMDANPSGSTKVAALASYAASVIGAPGLAAAGHPIGALIDIGGVPLAANQVAKILYAPGGAALLTRALKIPATAPIAEKLAAEILGKLTASEVGSIRPRPYTAPDRTGQVFVPDSLMTGRGHWVKAPAVIPTAPKPSR